MFKPNAAKLRLFELLLSLFLICGLAAYWRDSFRSFNVERFLAWDFPSRRSSFALISSRPK